MKKIDNKTGFKCDFCDKEAEYTRPTKSDSLYVCRNHKNQETMIVRSGLVNTADTFMELHLVRNRGNLTQAIFETENDIRSAIAYKDKHQEKLDRAKLEALQSLV